LLLDQTRERPFTIVDCGAGAGFIARTIMSANFNTPIEITGVEIYEPYVKPGKIREKMEQTVGCFHHLYTHPIIIADFTRWLDAAEERSVHTVIFGDSLEHVEPEQAKKTLLRARHVAKLGVIVNAPIVHYPQGPILGNEHETHLLQWSRQEWERQGGVHIGGNNTVGCFLFHPKP
jgi:2-polyprenyl-3-methyl-5-hydroxy-6-metoxy-1,4-benzoquinol methylase